MSKELIRLVDCTMAFDDEVVLDNITLNIHDKEFLTLLGPSGCGKTTTLRIIGGFQTPTAGDIFFDGVRINAVPAHKRAINTVFQRYALFPHLNVFENIAFGLRIPKAKEERDEKGKVIRRQKVKLTEKEIQERVMEMLETVSLKGFEHRRPEALSGGQQQRVAIARALALHPDILCFDEPTSALDPELTGEVLKVLRDLADRKTTMIIVTHEMHFARDVADRIMFMDGGVVVEEGSVQEIFSNPKTPAARRLVAPNGGSAARDLSSFAPDDHVVRVTFNGSSTAKPLVASLAAEKGILVSVLSADTRDLSGQCYGSMLLKLPAELAVAQQAVEYMRSQSGVTVEEVTGI